MYYYQSGAIGKAIHEKIQSVKQTVRSGSRKTETKPFGDVLKSYMGQTDTAKKTVSSVTATSSDSSVKSASGSTLLYALMNSDSDSTASAVLNTLGYSPYSATGSGTLRAAASDLSASANRLRLAVKEDSEEGTADAFARFTADYNLLIARLGLSSGTSGYLYRNALGVYATESGLEGTGLSVGENGTLTATGGEVDEERLSAFLTGVSTVAQNISTYSSSYGSIGGMSDYYSSLINLM